MVIILANNLFYSILRAINKDKKKKKNLVSKNSMAIQRKTNRWKFKVQLPVTLPIRIQLR